MTNYDLEEENLIKIQMTLSVILLFTTTVSLLLSYNSLLNLEKKNPIFTENDASDILLFNRTLVFIISILFIYINLQDKELKKENGNENEFADLQISASAFSLIASAIVLYVAINSGSNIVSQENPTI